MSTFDRALLETRISEVGQCGPKRTQAWNTVGVYTIRDFLAFEGTPPPAGAYDTILKNVIGLIGQDLTNEMLSKRKNTQIQQSSPSKQIQTIKHNWFNKKVHISTDGKTIRVGTIKEIAFTSYSGALVVVSLKMKRKQTLLVFTPQYILCMYNSWLTASIVSDDDEDVKEINSVSDLKFYLPPLYLDECPDGVDENSKNIVENETNLLIECIFMNNTKYLELTNKHKSISK